MGHINDMYHPDVQNKIREAVTVLTENKKRFGVSLGAADGKTIAYWKKLGMTVFSLGADFAFLREGAKRLYQTAKPLMEE